MITIVDYGVGNVASLANMLDYLGHETRVSGDPAVVARATRILLPGIGAFDKAMKTLEASGLIEPLRAAALDRRVPILGVCLGMQLLGRGSEEGELPGLGFIPADTKKLQPADPTLKVPNTGWRDLAAIRRGQLFPEIENQRFYFVHSYRMVCDDDRDVSAQIEYGGPVTVAVSRGNIHGVQFHPEKSHRFGMRLLNAFAEVVA